MYTGFSHIHSINKWIILILGVLAIANALSGWLKDKPYTATSNKLSLFFMVSMHVQLLLGVVLYFISPTVTGSLQDMGLAMKDSYLRYWTVEHLFVGILAIVFVTLGRVLAKKKATDLAKHKTTAIYYILTLVFVAVNVLLPLWKGKHLFPF